MRPEENRKNSFYVVAFTIITFYNSELLKKC